MKCVEVFFPVWSSEAFLLKTAFISRVFQNSFISRPTDVFTRQRHWTLMLSILMKRSKTWQRSSLVGGPTAQSGYSLRCWNVNTSRHPIPSNRNAIGACWLNGTLSEWSRANLSDDDEKVVNIASTTPQCSVAATFKVGFDSSATAFVLSKLFNIWFTDFIPTTTGSGQHRTDYVVGTIRRSALVVVVVVNAGAMLIFILWSATQARTGQFPDSMFQSIYTNTCWVAGDPAVIIYVSIVYQRVLRIGYKQSQSRLI